jgi:phage terminase small subunit
MASVSGLGEPVKPIGMEKYASQMWDQIIECHKSHGTLAAIDAAFIQSACEVWGLYRKAYDDAKVDPCDKNTCNAVKSYLGMWEGMARRLGMNPIDRVKIHPKVDSTKPSVASRRRA